MFLMPFFIISILTIFIAYIFNKSFAKSIITSLFFIPIIIYLAGLINNLMIGIYVIIIMCFTILFYFAYLIIKKKKDIIYRLKEIILSPGFAIFLILFISIHFYNINASFTYWDEWSHWGPYVKDMYLRNEFYNTNGHLATVHLNYPPFIQLFEFFYCKILGECNMQNIYCAYQLLCYSLGIILFENLKFDKNNIKNNLKILVVMVLSILYFVFINRIIDTQSNPIKSIYGDAFLGLSFSFFIINVLQYDFNDKFKTLNFVLSSIALVFSKQMGVPLFLLGFFTLFIITIYNKNLSKKNIIKGIILFIIPFIFYASWKLILYVYQITDQFDLHRKLNIKNLIDILFYGGGFDWQKEVIANFIYHIFNVRQLGLTIAMWLILLLIVFILTTFIVRNKYQKNFGIVSICVMVGFLLYLFSLLCLYLFTFSVYEATRLASFWRYVSTYIIGLTFVLGFVLIEHLIYQMKMNKKSILFLFISVFIIYLSIHFAKGTNYFPKKIVDSDYIKLNYDFKYMKNLEKGSDILIVCAKDKGLLGAKFKFEFFDKNFKSASFGTPYYEDDIWTMNKSNEEMYEYLNKFDYIYFYNADAKFRTTYNDIFKFIPENREGIYKVDEMLK